MLADIKKQHLIIFVLMLSLLLGGGVQYGKYLERKAQPPVSLHTGGGKPPGEETAAGESDKDGEIMPGQVVVHVAGFVERPGVYTLQEGSRIVDAVTLALPDKEADLNSINLAKKLSDQEMIIVPGPKGEDKGIPVPGTTMSNNSVSPANNQIGGLININTADQSQLETLPGIGPVKAQAIIQYREEKGYFTSIDDIQNVSGIGPATFNKLKDLITI